MGRASGGTPKGEIYVAHIGRVTRQSRRAHQGERRDSFSRSSARDAQAYVTGPAGGGDAAGGRRRTEKGGIRDRRHGADLRPARAHQQCTGGSAMTRATRTADALHCSASSPVSTLITRRGLLRTAAAAGLAAAAGRYAAGLRAGGGARPSAAARSGGVGHRRAHARPALLRGLVRAPGDVRRLQHARRRDPVV